MSWPRSLLQRLLGQSRPEPRPAAPPVPAGPTPGSEERLSVASIGDLVRAGVIDEARPWPPARVPLSPIVAGRDALARGPVRETQPHIAWDQPAYDAYPVPVFTLSAATLHGAVGITARGDRVLAETLWHTDPATHRYRRDGAGITLVAGPAETLPGTSLSLLGYAGNHFHALVEGVARIAAVPEAQWSGIDRILVPEGSRAADELLPHYGLPEDLAVRGVRPGEVLRAEHLVFPWTVHGLFEYHPRLSAFFDRVAAALPAGASPRRIYVDRRGGPHRPLLNEEAVVAALAGFGVVPVRLEEMTLTDQARLFRDADLVVAPHGAGLVNLGFARPGCAVVELMLDCFLNWCYRHLSGLRGLRYDCVVGHAVGAWQPADLSINAQAWMVPVGAVTEAVARTLAGATGSRG